MQVPTLMRKHLYTKHLPRIAILKAVCRFVVLLLSTFCSFSIFVAGVFFALATLLIIVSSSLTLHLAIEIKKKKTCLQWVSLPGKSWSKVSDARVLLACGSMGRDNLLAWGKLFASPYELKSRIWVWEEYNHFERFYRVCRLDRFLSNFSKTSQE